MILRLFSYLFGIGAVAVLIVAAIAAVYVGKMTEELPDYEVLSRYEPPVTTRIHAGDGSLIAEYARERRLYLPIQVIPNLVKAAFVSAEDKRFYEHAGVDFLALSSAVFDAVNSKLSGSNQRARGASGITQQVAKNFLLTSDRTIDRKAKELLLAMRIESAYSKDKILELYLNEIFFGLGSYGVAGASLSYFDKTVGQLKIHEMAYLAALPKGPNNYHPFRKTEAAVERRNWVIGRMLANGYITQNEADAAVKEPLSVKPRAANVYAESSEYFAEEVRREMISRYGTDTLYEGGLSVRSTLNPKLQKLATQALAKGLMKYDRGTGYHGPFSTIDMTKDWGEELANVRSLTDLRDWSVAVVLEASGEDVRIGLQPKRRPSGAVVKERNEATLALADMGWVKRVVLKGEKARSAKTTDEIFNPGDVLLISEKPDNAGYKLEQLPEVGGAMVAMDPHTGRVLAMVGGFSFAASQFNRATQANRQPGSAFKPFVYAAALDNGYTPSSVVLDGPIKINQGGTLGIWEPKNYSGKYAGPQTLRRGIENSRNLMTVRLANDMGMPLVSAYAKRFGIYDKPLRGLASSLGSRETTVLKMVSAYSVLANGGKQIKPSLIDRIQNRYGKTIYKHNEQKCENCNAADWQNQEEPEIVDTREQVLDPMTAYQITSMMEGVVQRGTAKNVGALGVPIAGKTGTTNEERDAWFVGYSPDLVVGVFVGFDRPRPMGKGNTGGGLAAPIFVDFMQEALQETSAIDFRVPTGIKLFPIAAKTGLLAQAGKPGVIMEAFKPGTKPPNKASVIGFASDMVRGQLRATDKAKEAVKKGVGGLF